MHHSQQFAVLYIDALPTRMRADVERHMHAQLASEPMAAPPGTDPLAATWCTRWERAGHNVTRCRQPLNGLDHELDALEQHLRALAATSGASIRLERL